MAKGKHRIKAHKRESGVGESISLKNFAKFKMIEFLDLVGTRGLRFYGLNCKMLN